MATTVLVKSAPSLHLLVVVHDPVGPNVMVATNAVAPTRVVLSNAAALATAGQNAMAVVTVHVPPSTHRAWAMQLSAPSAMRWSKRNWL